MTQRCLHFISSSQGCLLRLQCLQPSRRDVTTANNELATSLFEHFRSHVFGKQLLGRLTRTIYTTNMCDGIKYSRRKLDGAATCDAVADERPQKHDEGHGQSEGNQLQHASSLPEVELGFGLVACLRQHALLL